MNDGLPDLGQFGTKLHENLGGHAFTFAYETKEDVLGADVIVTEL